MIKAKNKFAVSYTQNFLHSLHCYNAIHSEATEFGLWSKHYAEGFTVRLKMQMFCRILWCSETVARWENIFQIISKYRFINDKIVF